MRVSWDIETYVNCFTLSAEDCDSPIKWAFEISPWKDDSRAIVEWVQWLIGHNAQMVGFNNVGFDYPVLHTLLQMGKATPQVLYDKAMSIIHAQDSNRFASIVYPSDRYIEQIDLFRIHHFDNKARSTSLKALEFNMRMDNISDLPFPVGSILTREQVPVLLDYNAHDATATKRFYHQSIEQIEFRAALSKKHGRDFMNHSDVKIGKEIFQMELEKAGVQCYKYGPNGREPAQTKRASIAIKDCILPWIVFENPEFNRIHQWLKEQVITETKGVFTDLTASAYGLEFVFGTGGLHASVENRVISETEDRVIESKDVSSYYPNLSIVNRFYPEHLTEKFCDVYQSVYEQRKSHKKGTVENAALKLSLNGAYGASNDKFSVFFDPMFTLKITLNGQMLLCLLIEKLCKIPTVEIIICNTDGLEYTIHPDRVADADNVCSKWCELTGLVLEGARYSKMFIRDCNSYIAVYKD